MRRLGLTFAMVQDAVDTLPVPAFLAYRFLAAAALVAVLFRAQLRRLDAPGVRAGVVMGALLTAGYFLQTYALEHTTASNAGFLTGLFTPATPLLAALVLRVRLSGTALAAAALATLGVALLSGVGGEGLHPLGDALAVGCALCFSAHILATDRGVSALRSVRSWSSSSPSAAGSRSWSRSSAGSSRCRAAAPPGAPWP